MTSTIDLDSARLDDDGAPAWTARRRDRSGVRLVWAGEGTGGGLAARWWPRSRDAVSELRKLIPVVSERLGGPVTRVSLNIDAWGPDQPRRLQIGDRRVRLGWFHTIDPATVTLGRGSYDRVALLVVDANLDSAIGRDVVDELPKVPVP
jgi:hypothetical protein